MASGRWHSRITFGIVRFSAVYGRLLPNAVSAAETVWVGSRLRIGRGKGAAPRSEGPGIESMGHLVFRARAVDGLGFSRSTAKVR